MEMDTTKTYQQSQNGAFFDWTAFLEISKKEYTEHELKLAKFRAENWVTCACGNQCDLLPREDDGSPKDKVLARLGMRFAQYISYMYYYFSTGHMNDFNSNRMGAWLTLLQIEDQSAGLLADMKRRNN